MPNKKAIQNAILLPLSKIYGAVTSLRNLMFRMHILNQRQFDIPVIVVGNVQVGGTGKTPHTEYIIEALRSKYHIGMISRGYKRKTKGFVLANRRSTPNDIGDEPYQIAQKFGDSIRVAVCEDRCEGIDTLRKIDPTVNLIVLDDAYQHRYVKPTVSIVLTEFGRPYFMDKMLPLGHLREKAVAVERADMVIITKCPVEIKPIEIRIFKKNLNLFPFQVLSFSRMVYSDLVPLFPEEAEFSPMLSSLTDRDTVLAVAGIANPKPFYKYLSTSQASVKMLVFPDHHNFSHKDINMIEKRFDDLGGEGKFIITTEKDAVRLANNPYFPHKLKPYIYYQPIDVEFDDTYSPGFIEDLEKLIRDAMRQ